VAVERLKATESWRDALGRNLALRSPVTISRQAQQEQAIAPRPGLLQALADRQPGGRT
jgi:hypothetical protein